MALDDLPAVLRGRRGLLAKISGRAYNEKLAQFSAAVIFIGFNLTFLPQFVLGGLGMPRRYPSYPEEWQVFHVLSTAGASVLAVGYLLPLCYLTWSFFFGRPAPQNPWNASGLEWNEAGSPPIRTNFETLPRVTKEAYDYPHPRQNPR